MIIPHNLKMSRLEKQLTAAVAKRAKLDRNVASMRWQKRRQLLQEILEHEEALVALKRELLVLDEVEAAEDEPVADPRPTNKRVRKPEPKPAKATPVALRLVGGPRPEPSLGSVKANPPTPTPNTLPDPPDPSLNESSMLIACHQRGGSTYAEWLAAHPDALLAGRGTGIRAGPAHIWDRLRQKRHILVTRERRDKSIVYRVSAGIRECLDQHDDAVG